MRFPCPYIAIATALLLGCTDIDPVPYDASDPSCSGVGFPGLDPMERRVGKKFNDVLERGWLWGNREHGPIGELAADGITLSKRFVYGTRSWVPDSWSS